MKTLLTVLTLSIVSIASAGLPVLPGPYAEDFEGVENTAPVFEGWITRVVNTSRTNLFSGGFSRSDSGSEANVETAVVGKPQGFTIIHNLTHVYSLGNGGSITLGFSAPIINGDGPDFAVFENAFAEGLGITFAELATVEVASEIDQWVTFPVTYLNTNIVYDLSSGNRSAGQDVTFIDGLAGKNIVHVGTPFDLQLLSTHPAVASGLVDLNNINYIRLTDVIGDGSALDQFGKPIYDPYYNVFTNTLEAATPLSTDGFDLRGIGVLHHATPASIEGNQIQWTAHTNALYQVEMTPSLTPPAWGPIGGIVTGAQQQVTIPLPDIPYGILRVRKWRP